MPRTTFQTLFKWRLAFFLLLMVELSGCALWRKIVRTVKPQSAVQSHEMETSVDPAQRALENKDYSQGLEAVKQARFDQAIESLTQFRRKYPTSRFSQAAAFHLGRAYEELNQWSKAVDQYRFVAAHASSSDELRARSFYRLSFAYEALGEDSKTIAALRDALERRSYLPMEVSRAEAPSRLAAAYARVGNEASALEFYDQAESGIQYLRRLTKGGAMPSWLPKTLFYMGTMTVEIVHPDNFEIGLRPLKRAQVYLLQAAEMENPVWSPLAVERLISIYIKLWRVIEAVPARNLRDRTLALKERQNRQWEMAYQILDVIAELRVHRLPRGQIDSVSADKIFEFIDWQEGKVRRLLAQRSVGEGLTEEAKEREGLRRRGRIGGSPTILEKKSGKILSLPRKKRDKGLSKDPNL